MRSVTGFLAPTFEQLLHMFCTVLTYLFKHITQCNKSVPNSHEIPASSTSLKTKSIKQTRLTVILDVLRKIKTAWEKKHKMMTG